MAKIQLQISPGTESIIRANFVKGFYYHDDESLLNCADTLSQFSQDKTIIKQIEDFRAGLNEIKSIKEKMRLSRAGEIYLQIWKQNELADKLTALECKTGSLKKDLINFVIQKMENKKLMAKSFTILTLKKLPLTLRGTRATGPEEEAPEEEEYYEEEY